MKKHVFLSVLWIVLAAMVFPVFAEQDETAQIKKSGILRFGTASDYVPFVFYDANNVLTGLDVALIKEIGRRMDVEVEVVDMAFDGLIDAVSIGQVNIIGGALAKTASREVLVDFTRVYYQDQAELITLASANIPTNFSFDQIKGKKIGVQVGTDFEQWVQVNLVQNGLLEIQNVYTYKKALGAMKALEEGQVDFVIIDNDVYQQVYANSGKFKVAKKDLVSENFAFAVKKGSNLDNEINRVINEMMADGKAQEIANKFFNMEIIQKPEPVISDSRPSQMTTPEPTQKQDCLNAMTFLSDLNYPDGTKVEPNAKFTKIWRLYNNGTCAWDSSYSFDLVSGDNMNANHVVITETVKPGHVYDVAVELSAPAYGGQFIGKWQMRNPNGTGFGQTVWVNIIVSGTPNITEMPKSIVPVVYQFQPDVYKASLSYCPTVYWYANSADRVEFYINNFYVGATTNMKGSAKLCNWKTGGKYNIVAKAVNNQSSACLAFTYVAQNDGTKPPVPMAPRIP